MKKFTPPEYWDLYDYMGKHVGKIKRGIEIPGGLYHISIEVVPTDMKGHMLITQRSFSKRKGSGKYEFPAGSVMAGEKPAMAALRELSEETGLRATKLIHIQTEKTPYHPDMSGLIRQTFAALVENLEQQEIKLQEGETIDYKIVTLEELKQDYLLKDLFDASRLSMYRDDFFERLEKLVGTPPERKEDMEKPAPRPKFRLVKSGMLSSDILKSASTQGNMEESNL